MSPLDRREFTGNRPVTQSDIRRLLDGLVDDLAERLADRVRIETVATVNQLPDTAAPNRMFRVAADPNGLYVGNGPNRPLSRTTLTPLS